MAATIEHTLGVKPRLVAGGGGIFDVQADGRMVFSKHQVGRFPDESEVLAGLRKVSG